MAKEKNVNLQFNPEGCKGCYFEPKEDGSQFCPMMAKVIEKLNNSEDEFFDNTSTINCPAIMINAPKNLLEKDTDTK